MGGGQKIIWGRICPHLPILGAATGVYTKKLYFIVVPRESLAAAVDHFIGHVSRCNTPNLFMSNVIIKIFKNMFVQFDRFKHKT
jgi:hypothetical protein